MSVYINQEHIEKAEDLVRKTHANGGLAPVELDSFWVDQEKAINDPWGEECPQVPLGMTMSGECAFDELGLAENWYKLYHDPDYRIVLSKKYNDISEKIVGKRLLNEVKPDPDLAWPEIKQLYDIFGAENVWHNESYWLKQCADNEKELENALDDVETRLDNLKEFMLPDNWEKEKQRLTDAGCEVPLYRGQRGPITFAMSLYGVENLIFLIIDNPELAARFRDLIIKAMLERARILDEEAGFTPETAPHGFYFCDDNCAMLNYEMYEFFGYPILKAIFERYSPNPDDRRGQHSDSDMGHLLPHFGKLGLNTCNFGPNLTVEEIRDHLPEAVIHGQLAPFTLSRNEEVNIVAEFIRDYEMAKDKKGLIWATAGSINNGSRLTGMRLIMAAIQEYGRY